MIFTRLRTANITPKKTEEINALLLQFSYNAKKLSPAQLKGVLRQPGMVLFVAIEDSAKIVGMGSLYTKKTFMRKTGIIEDVVVDNNYRGRGIGEEITKNLIAVARELLFLDCVELTSNPERIEANALYKKLGFEKRETNCYRLNL